MNTRLILGLGVLLMCRSLAIGQTSSTESKPAWNARPRVEIFAGVAAGHILRVEDKGYGTGLNVGAGVEGTVWRGLRAGAEVNRTFGLSPVPVQCGSIYPGPGQPAFPCTGSARAGVGAATAASFTAAYYFGERRIQPFLVGGISILHTREFASTSIVRADHIELTENSSSGTGTGMTLGFGMRASLTRHFSIRPELRFSDGSALASGNFSQVRLSVGLGYSW